MLPQFMIHFNTKVGAPVRGDDHYRRPHLIRKFWKRVAAGEHVLIAAPRRVGKTSLVFDLCDNPEPGFHPIFLSTEAVSNERDLFKKLYDAAMGMISGKEALGKSLASLFKRLKIERSLDGTYSLSASRNDGYEDLLSLLRGLPKGEHFVFMVDEFSQAVENIRKRQGDEAARDFLHKMRELRQDPEVQQRASFVYAGSIGLEQIVGRLNCAGTINDLVAFDLPPFTEKEAKALIERIISGNEVTFKSEVRQYLLDKLVWLIPYFIQVVMDEVEGILNEDETDTVTKAMIDQAMINAQGHRNYYDHWHQRLSILFAPKERRFAKEILDRCSTGKPLAMDEVADLGLNKHKLPEQYSDVIRSLIHDGYVWRDAVRNTLRFNSPLLMSWWANHIAL